MFRYMCTSFGENTMSGLKNQVLLRSCYLCVPWSVAASSLMLIICKTVQVYILFSLKMVHMYRNMLEKLIYCVY